MKYAAVGIENLWAVIDAAIACTEQRLLAMPVGTYAKVGPFIVKREDESIFVVEDADELTRFNGDGDAMWAAWQAAVLLVKQCADLRVDRGGVGGRPAPSTVTPGERKRRIVLRSKVENIVREAMAHAALL